MRCVKALVAVVVLSGATLVSASSFAAEPANTSVSRLPANTPVSRLKVGSEVTAGETFKSAKITSVSPKNFSFQVPGPSGHPPFSVTIIGAQPDFSVADGEKAIKDTLKAVFGIGEGGGGGTTTTTSGGSGGCINITISGGSNTVNIGGAGSGSGGNITCTIQ
jgi:hypothetical protein